MNNNLYVDIGEEIIQKLKELNLLLEKKLKKVKDEEKFPTASIS